MKTPKALLFAGLTLVGISSLTAALGQDSPSRTIRAGMIGLDTSHVPAFARAFNSDQAAGDLAGIKVVAGYPGGTDIPASRDRVGKFTEQLRQMKVEIVDTIPALLERVDVVLLESVDGRIHLQEAIPVIKQRKPLWIDKPVAGSLADAIVIYELAKKHNVPCFSSSSGRFSAGLKAVLSDEKVGSIVGASTWGSCTYSPGTPDMFFYGIHGIEPLFVLLGRGCETVSRLRTEDTDFVTGVWQGGRVGSYRGIRRAAAESGAIVYGTKGIAEQPKGEGGGYEPLCREIARFFKSGKAPVSAEETIEIFTFMEAADESKRQGGAPVSMSSVLEKARKEAAGKLAKM
jgi:predicted dehydrogenase